MLDAERHGVGGDVLPCIRASLSSSLQVTTTGEPVWPLCDNDAFEAVTRAAALWDGRTEFVASRLARSESRQGVVVGLGAAARGAAELYAHLTRRGLQLRATIATGPLDPATEVIVAVGSELTPTVLRTLHDADLETSPGIISGDTPDELWRRALTASAACALSGRLPSYWVEFVPLSAAAECTKGQRTTVGGQTPATRIATLLAARAPLLTVFTHSDGVCAHFGPKVLCAMVDRPTGMSGRGVRPACLASGSCHRLKRSYSQALGDGRLLSPRTLAAPVLVLHTCYGFLPAGALVHPSWGHTRSLLTSGAVGALVVPWGLSFGSERDLQPLVDQLATGVCLGTALARFRRSSAGRSERTHFCLFGDPRNRLQPFDVGPSPLQPKGTPLGPAPRHFLQALVATAIERNAVASAGEADNDATTAVARWVETRRWGDAERLAVLRAISARGAMTSKLWLSLSLAPWKRNTEVGSCPSCGEQTSTYDAAVVAGSLEHRQLVVCPLCGVVDDRRVHAAQLAMSIGDDAVLVQGHLRGEWARGVWIETFGKRFSAWRDWPRSPFGGIADAVSLDPLIPPGRSFVSVFLLSADGELRVLTRPVLR